MAFVVARAADLREAADWTLTKEELVRAVDFACPLDPTAVDCACANAPFAVAAFDVASRRPRPRGASRAASAARCGRVGHRRSAACRRRIGRRRGGASVAAGAGGDTGDGVRVAAPAPGRGRERQAFPDPLDVAIGFIGGNCQIAVEGDSDCPPDGGRRICRELYHLIFGFGCWPQCRRAQAIGRPANVSG